MFAIIESGGKQYKVSEGDMVQVDLFDAPEDNKVVFDSVLLIADDNDTTVGQPTIKNATVEGEYVSEEKGKKLIVFKMKRRKASQKRTGHRQKYSLVKITKINASGAPKPAQAKKEEPAAQKEVKQTEASVKAADTTTEQTQE